MTLPLSELILSALVDRLRHISPENGYYTDAGARVGRGRRTWPVGDLPAVSLFDGGEQAVDSGGTDSMRITRTFSVHIFAEVVQEETGSVLTLLEADVKACLVGWSASLGMREALGSAASALIYVGSEPVEREEGSSFEHSVLTFTTKYPEKHGDPTST